MVEPLSLVLGVAGAAWGVAADRISSRWPAHEDGSARKMDWRTIVLAAFGAVALAAVPVRFGGAAERVLFLALFATLTLQMATDLDQRLLPGILTLPVRVAGALVLVWGGDSLVNRQPAWLAVGAAIVLPLVLYVISLPFGDGAFGEGDVVYLAGVGLVLGAIRLVIAVFASAIIGGVVIVLLLATRRVTLRSYIPLGPLLIVGTLWAALLPATS